MACGLQVPFVVAIIVVALLVQASHALHTEGTTILRANSTVFITKFCFTFNPNPYGDRSAGAVNLTLRAPDASRLHRVHMLLFDDEQDSYPGPSSEWNSLTCEERMEHAKNYESVDWTIASQPDGQQIVFMIRQKLRPRWWYIALSDCSENTVDLEVKYQLHTWNPAYGWAREFSTDKRFSLYVFLTLAIVYGCLAAVQLHANAALAERAGSDSASGKAAHPFARILASGILLAFGEAVLSATHNGRFAYNGVGAPTAYVASQLLAVCSNFILASLLLLVSQGKCVSYIMVASDARKMFKMLGPFLVSCFVLELWGEYSISRNYTTDYVYTTPFGWALILVDLLLLSAYCRNLRFTYEAERGRDDGRFYSTWGLVYALWFLALPVTAVLAQLILAPYVWYIVSISVKKGVTALMYGALVVGLWPGNTKTYFKLERARGRAMASSPDASPPGGASPSPAQLGLLGRFLQPLPDKGRISKLGMSP